MKTIQELLARQEQINNELGALEGRELNDKEKANREALLREFESNKRQIITLNQKREAEKNAPAAPKNSEILSAQMRELRNGERREITFASNITASGAIEQEIKPMLETLNEGLDLPEGVAVVGGVIGSEIWPVSVNDVDMEEKGENVSLTDRVLDFDKITPTVKRVGLSIPVSNTAIDHAAFDLAGFVTKKIAMAKRRYLASRLYSQANWGAGCVKGPFSGLTPAGVIDLTGNNSAAQILEAVAGFIDKGFDPASDNLCLVIDAVSEAKLKVEPIVYGESAGMCIQNGLLLGYKYKVSHFINTTLNGKNLVATSKRYLGIGFWNYIAVQQHGVERMTIDGTSQAVAKTNTTAFVLNTEYSITDLSLKLNNKGGTDTQAFALYELKFGDGSSASK